LAKHGTNKRARGNPRKGGFPLYLWAVIGLCICLIVAFIVVSNPFTSTTPVQTNGLKCAIVDQLYNIEPNQTFIERTTQEVKSLGFEVDVYRGDEVTVDFYRQLPSYGYKLIILRVHAGLLENETGRGNTIWLFTSERYSRLRYYFAQLRNQVTVAKTSVSTTPVFAVSAKFVTDCMQGNFNNTVIINMGCSAFYSDEMAQAFVKKGASTYLGWDASVGLFYVDGAEITLIEKLCSKGLTVKEAVTETLKEKGPDPNNKAFLKFYPETSAGKTLRELVQ
jgi:hypothetical protein